MSEKVKYCDCPESAKLAKTNHLYGTFNPVPTVNGYCKFCKHIAVSDPSSTQLYNSQSATPRKCTVGSYHMVDDPNTVPKAKVTQQRRTLIVTNIETGEVQTFAGIKPAIKALKISQDLIYRCLKNKQSWKGYKFKQIIKKPKGASRGSDRK